MALKIKGGQTVPALQPREPFFDGEKLHIGKLDGSGNQEIGGGGSLPVFVIDTSSLEFQNKLQSLVTDEGVVDGEPFYFYIDKPGRYIFKPAPLRLFAIYINLADGEYCEVAGCPDDTQVKVFMKGWEVAPSGYEQFRIDGYVSFPGTLSVYCFAAYTSEIEGEIKSRVMPFGYRQDFPIFTGGAQ